MLENLPIKRATYTGIKNRIILAGQHKFLFVTCSQLIRERLLSTRRLLRWSEIVVTMTNIEWIKSFYRWFTIANCHLVKNDIMICFVFKWQKVFKILKNSRVIVSPYSGSAIWTWTVISSPTKRCTPHFSITCMRIRWWFVFGWNFNPKR